MNIKIRAAVYTVAFLVGAVIVSFVVAWIGNNVPGQYIFYAFIAAMGLSLCYLVYNLMLSRLEHEEAFKRHIGELDKIINDKAV